MGKIFTLASGSSGNCTYIGQGKNGLLVDVGISAKAITSALKLAAIEPKTLQGILITHTHTDHIKGLNTFVSRYDIPVFASKETALAIENSAVGCPFDIHIIDGECSVGEFLVNRFDTSHDSPGSSGYTVTFMNGDKCGVCTDLGIVTEEVRKAITGCNALLLESNHDVTMLQKGNYPEYLKRRILSDKGHLSNVACAKELINLVNSGTLRIILGHLSRENNEPLLAKSCATSVLLDNGMRENDDYLLFVAPPDIGKFILF